MLRFPNYLGPALFCTSMSYQLLVSPLMLFVALSLDGRGALPHTVLWVLLLVAMSLAFLGMGLMGCYMVPKKRATFYKVRHERGAPAAPRAQGTILLLVLAVFPTFPAQPRQHKSFKTYVDEYCWETRVVCSSGTGHDVSRADVLGYARWSWPVNEKVGTWLERWDRWEQERPSW